MTIFRTCLAVTLLGMNLGLAQDEFDPLGEAAEANLPKIVRVFVEFIEIPQATMTELLAAPRKSANDGDLRTKLQELIKTEKARMLETQMLTARSGQKATTESIHEYVYPTEYEPSSIPSGVPPEQTKVEEHSKLMAAVVPTVWETRNVGSTLEIEPNIGENNHIIDLRLLPQLVYHTGNNLWMEHKEGENTYRAEMPNFYKISLDTSMTLINGQTFLMSSCSPKDDKGEVDMTKKILIFVRADVLTVGR